MYAQQIEAAWKSLRSSKNLYMAVRSQTSVHFETPIDQGLPDDAPQFSLVRVFTDYEDAERYCKTLEAYFDVEYTPMRCSLDEIFSVAVRFDNYPVRFELCEMPEDEHPRNLMTIHSNDEVVH